ncbi:MAG: hypothetical protein Q9175_002949 [Cornicularia normoerica]
MSKSRNKKNRDWAKANEDLLLKPCSGFNLKQRRHLNWTLAAASRLLNNDDEEESKPPETVVEEEVTEHQSRELYVFFKTPPQSYILLQKRDQLSETRCRRSNRISEHALYFGKRGHLFEWSKVVALQQLPAQLRAKIPARTSWFLVSMSSVLLAALRNPLWGVWVKVENGQGSSEIELHESCGITSRQMFSLWYVKAALIAPRG